MKRIAIIGCAGAGKLVLARRLGPVLGLEVIHLDSLHWKPGWIATPKAEWAAIVERLVSCLWRTVRRALLSRGRSRPNMAQGLPERLLHRGFVEFLLWIRRYPVASRPVVLEVIREYADGRRIIVLRSAAEVSRFPEEVGQRVA